ncbi:MAG: ATP-dependent DNA ligase [Rhodoglobus sp.]
MGTLTYDSTLAADFDDRKLAHLQIVIGAKLRRNEAFYFSWKDDVSIGNGRTVIWVHPTLPLSFKYFGSKPPTINRNWIDEMMLLANTPSGLYLVPEPVAGAGDGE